METAKNSVKMLKKMEQDNIAYAEKKKPKGIVIGKVVGEGLKMKIKSPITTTINYERWKHE